VVTQPNSTIPTYVTTDQASSLTRLSRATLANRRSLKLPPSYYKAHGRVIYAVSDLVAFLEAGRVETSAA